MSFDPSVSPTPAITVLDNKKKVWANFVTNDHKRGRPNWLVVRTTIGNILIMHGSEDGSLALPDDEVHFILDNNKVDWVHCCYPKQVLAHFPRLQGKILFPEHGDVTYRNVWGNRTDKLGNYVQFAVDRKDFPNSFSSCTVI